MTRGNGLSEAYTATLSRLKGQKGYKSVLGLKVLMWVLYSERPLRGEELCHALGVEIGSADLDPENVPALRTLVASCLGLVTVEESSSTVRLVHFTLKEHLSSDPTLFHNPHSAMAEVYLTYLNFRSVLCLSPTLDSAPVTTPLLEYASVHWGVHATKGMTEPIKILALRLLDRFDQHISAHLLLLHYHVIFNEPYYSEAIGPRAFTGLHGAAFLGIVEIAAALLDMKEWDVNAFDCTGNTALTWAARRGHSGVVKMLLERKDINPDKADTGDSGCERTPLLWAARNGHSGVVQMLLEREDVNPSAVDSMFGQMPLALAAENGHLGVVKMLLEREGVNPDEADTCFGRTPLSLAAANGHLGVVKMLLEREEVNPGVGDIHYGETPLLLAAENGHSGVVKILLERGDVNLNQAETEFGRTPLLCAIENGHWEIVNILLERNDINLDQADTFYGRTPLSWAAEKAPSEVVKMLLEREDVNPNQADTFYGKTPLSYANWNKHSGIVKMFSERRDVLATVPDN